jgi:hypothetical protein
MQGVSPGLPIARLAETGVIREERREAAEIVAIAGSLEVRRSATRLRVRVI